MLFHVANIRLRQDQSSYGEINLSRFSRELNASADRAKAKRAFEAMMTMRKIDIAALEAAVAKNP